MLSFWGHKELSVLQFQADIPRFARSFRKTVVPDEEPTCGTQWECDRLLYCSPLQFQAGGTGRSRAEQW